MPQKTLNFEVTLNDSRGTFSLFKKKNSKDDYDFSGLVALRHLLSNERARMLETIKNDKPKSIYELGKILGRNLKSVVEDIKLLERFGFVELTEEKTKNRIRHRPELVADSVVVTIKL